MCIEIRQVNRVRGFSGSQAGLSLIELIMFVVIVGVGVAGILMAFNLTTQKSADPQIRKQMLAVAEALLEEVTLKPFTYCDPDDPIAATATGGGDCAAGMDESASLGPEANDTSRAVYDNVSDYNGLSLSPFSDINGTTITGYSATVSVTQQQLEAGIPLDASLRITVTVTHGGDSLALSAYRLRYAPRSLP